MFLKGLNVYDSTAMDTNCKAFSKIHVLGYDFESLQLKNKLILIQFTIFEKNILSDSKCSESFLLNYLKSKSYKMAKNSKNGSLSLCPSTATLLKSETLLNTCIAHSNGVDLLLFNNASDWLSGDFYNKSQ